MKRVIVLILGKLNTRPSPPVLGCSVLHKLQQILMPLWVLMTSSLIDFQSFPSLFTIRKFRIPCIKDFQKIKGNITFGKITLCNLK